MFDALYETIRKACPPPEWNAGVKLARADAVVGTALEEDEIELKVTPSTGVALEVSLYPLDDDWCCDCDTRALVCKHVAAAIIATKQARGAGKDLPTTERDVGHVRYVLRRGHRGLELERYAVVDGSPHRMRRVSLTAAAAGRAEQPPVAVGSEDLDVEEAMDFRPDGRILRDRMPRVLRALSRCRDVRLEDDEVQASARVVVPWGLVEEAGDAFRVSVHPDPRIEEVFHNGAALVEGVLRPVGEAGLSHQEMRDLGGGRYFGPTEVTSLVTEVLPELERRIRVEVRTDRLPGVSDAPPRVVVETGHHEDRLVVEGQIVYGDPVSARVVDGQLRVTGEEVPVRDTDEEDRLARELRSELGLLPGQPAVLDGEEAVAFAQRLRAWESGDVLGDAWESFTLAAPIEPSVEIGERDFELSFESPSGRASASRVLAAWKRGSTLAPLDGGGWAPIPADFLRRHGQLVADLLDAKALRDELPTSSLPDLARLAKATGAPPPPALEGLEALVDGFEGLPAATLPDDLTATLRSYQRRGVDWLDFMRRAGLGGLLADDMGLGKTLQALTAVRGRTLVVAPASVLQNWRLEAERFRPGLDVCVYHGPRRTLDADADVIITTYGLLRMDVDRLSAERWDAVILDEAQAIKNPDSQVAQAAYRLDADFRVTLTGTPVENRLDELWSQMHFLNPGLLGSHQGFNERYEKPIADGVAGAASRLRERIRPFVLRRLKRDVAPELPPRTDMVLHVALSEEERAAYDAIRAATREEIVERLGAGVNAIQALEALMRLRQAACHRGMLPGHEADGSSKVEVLLETLDEAASEGHKALVFSQWTSYLDLVEPHLRAAGLDFVRLDGSTRDRQAVVDAFQSDDGPPVMLISLKAGGTGLNLTAADHVFLLDPWWNPAVEDQAADRAHRIGQDKPVLVHRLVAEDTVEERILALQESKRALADAAMGGADRAASLTRDDLMALLA
ncbi:MAG: DEAD/DEAH box helicase [Myxococcota bacterium]